MTRYVWLVRDLGKDYSAATEYGMVSPIFGRDVSPMDLGKQTKIILRDVFPVASSEDAILITSPIIMVANLVSLWTARFSTARFLVWDAARGRYDLRWTRSAVATEWLQRKPAMDRPSGPPNHVYHHPPTHPHPNTGGDSGGGDYSR